MPDESPRDYLHHMHVPPSLKDAIIDVNKNKIREVTSNLRKKMIEFRQGRGVTDTDLLDQAVSEFETMEKEKKKIAKQEAIIPNDSGNKKNDPVVVAGDHRNGFVVLGMHRSGTSMLSGLLNQAAGYEVGGPLIGSAFDNEMGFFERVDVVLQNDEFMKAQSIWWSANVINYDWERALADKDSGKVSFKEGERGLQFLNNPKNAPWMQKDPRMCITLKTWLKLIDTEPAILFTYRHPLEVALSLNKRDSSISLETGLRLWIVYNMRAIQNSRGLCMVKSSNDVVLTDTLNEVQRISNELTKKCGVPPPPKHISRKEINKLVDPNLQHNKKKRAKGSMDVIESYNDGKCVVNSYVSKHDQNSKAYESEYNMYRTAMKVYCDFESKTAYREDYSWPKLLRQHG